VESCYWEGGLIFDTNNGRIAALVGLHTRYVMLAKIGSKNTGTVINVQIKQAHKRITSTLAWRRASRYISAIRRVLGKEALTRTPMVY